MTRVVGNVETKLGMVSKTKKRMIVNPMPPARKNARRKIRKMKRREWNSFVLNNVRRSVPLLLLLFTLHAYQYHLLILLVIHHQLHQVQAHQHHLLFLLAIYQHLFLHDHLLHDRLHDLLNDRLVNQLSQLQHCSQHILQQ